jgi:chaperonin GroES
MKLAHRETIELMGDCVMVRRFDPETESGGGIMLPEIAQKVEPRGKVVAVGPGRDYQDGTRRKLDVKVGDIVIIANGSGMQKVTLKGHPKELFCLDYDGILGIVRGDE